MAAIPEVLIPNRTRDNRRVIGKHRDFYLFIFNGHGRGPLFTTVTANKTRQIHEHLAMGR